MLRDDYNSYYAPGSSGSLLDDDGRSSVPTGISDTPGPGVPGEDTGGGTVNPLVTVRQRLQAGYDDDGNANWVWADVVRDQEAIMFTARDEVSNAAGIVTVKATVQFLYGGHMPTIRETASVKTSDGLVWSVAGSERFPDRYQLDLERIDDGA
jgi:hypothetical protein